MLLVAKESRRTRVRRHSKKLQPRLKTNTRILSNTTSPLFKSSPLSTSVHPTFLKIWTSAWRNLKTDKQNLPKKVRPLKSKPGKTQLRRLSNRLRKLRSKVQYKLSLTVEEEVAVAEATEETKEVEELVEVTEVVAEKNRPKKEKTLTLIKLTKSLTTLMMITSITRLLLALPEGTRNRIQRSRVP